MHERDHERDQPPPAEAETPPGEQAPPAEEAQSLGSSAYSSGWDASVALDAESAARKKSSPRASIEVKTLAMAADGQEHLQIVWTDKWVPGGTSVWFEITTLEENSIEANPRQRNFNKTYRGLGRVKTDVLPLGRIGWRGKMAVLDADSGEIKEVRWTWVPLYPGILYRVRRFLVGE